MARPRGAGATVADGGWCVVVTGELGNADAQPGSHAPGTTMTAATPARSRMPARLAPRCSRCGHAAVVAAVGSPCWRASRRRGPWWANRARVGARRGVLRPGEMAWMDRSGGLGRSCGWWPGEVEPEIRVRRAARAAACRCPRRAVRSVARWRSRRALPFVDEDRWLAIEQARWVGLGYRPLLRVYGTDSQVPTEQIRKFLTEQFAACLPNTLASVCRGPAPVSCVRLAPVARGFVLCGN